MDDNLIRLLTLICVAIAGEVFIICFYLNKPFWALVGAFFDWLPLPTGWMRFAGLRRPPVLHITLTLVAYAFFVLWFFFDIMRVPFLAVWFLAVLSGAGVSQAEGR